MRITGTSTHLVSFLDPPAFGNDHRMTFAPAIEPQWSTHVPA